MSLQESSVSLYQPRLASTARGRDPRNSMSTRLLDDLLVEIAPKKTERNSGSIDAALEKNNAEKGQGQEANDRRKQIISKFQKLVLLQQASAKRESTVDRPNDSTATNFNQKGPAVSTVSNALGEEEQPSHSKSQSRASTKLSKNVQIFSKSFSNLTKIAKSNRSTENIRSPRSMSSDSVIQMSPRDIGATTNESWKQNTTEKSSRFSLLKKMNSRSRLGLDTSDTLLDSSYSKLTLDDDPTEADDAPDDASLGDYIEYALGDSLSSATPIAQNVEDQRNLGNSAHKAIAQASSHSLGHRREHHLSQRRRSSVGSVRSMSSVESRSSQCRQRNRSRTRRQQNQLHGSSESLRALVGVLAGEVPPPCQEKVTLESRVGQRRKMKGQSLESVSMPQPASMPDLRSYEEDALSVRALTGSRYSNRRKEWKNDNSSLMQSPQVRSNRSLSRSLSKLPRVDHYDSKGPHNATWDNDGTTEGKVYLRRSVTSKAHQDLLHIHSQSASAIFVNSSNNEAEAAPGEEEMRLPIRSERVRSIKSVKNRSLSTLQAASHDAYKVGSVSKQRRRSTLVTGDNNEEQVLSRSPSAGSTYVLGSRSLAQLDRMSGGIQAGSVSDNNRNAMWEVNGKKERHPKSSHQSPGVRPVRSGKRRSLPNLQGFQDDMISIGTSRTSSGFDDTLEVTNCKTWAMSVDRPSPVAHDLQSKSMGMANRSLPNLQALQSPRMYQCQPDQHPTFDHQGGLPTLEAVPVHDDMDGRHNATWESGAPTNVTQDKHLQLVLRLPNARPSSQSSTQLSQSLHALSTHLAVNGAIDDALARALRSSRARRSGRSSSSLSQLSQSLHSGPTSTESSTSGNDETKGRDIGSSRRKASSHRRSIKSSVSRDGDISAPNPHNREPSGNLSITTSRSSEVTKDSTNQATTVSRPIRKSTSLDQSQHNKTETNKGMECEAASSTPSITKIQPAISLDLLLQTPRPKQRGLQNSRGNRSLPNLQDLSDLNNSDSNLSVRMVSHNATWDLDEAKEKAKSRSRTLKKSLGSQSFSNLEEIDLIRSKMETSHMVSSSSVQPPFALQIQVR